MLYSAGAPKPKVSFIRIRLTAESINGYAAQTTNSWKGGSGSLIEISTEYLKTVEPSIRFSEISGMVIHEMTHVFQYSGRGTTPSSLIEGIAGYMRLINGWPNAYWQNSTADDPLVDGVACAYFCDSLKADTPVLLLS